MSLVDQPQSLPLRKCLEYGSLRGMKICHENKCMETCPVIQSLSRQTCVEPVVRAPGPNRNGSDAALVDIFELCKEVVE
jgi:hypothetical protein